jgi:hypothetical protein
LEFFGLHAVELEYTLARERLFEPIEKLRSRVDLVVVLALREDRHLVQILGKPGRRLGEMDEAVLDRPGLRAAA